MNIIKNILKHKILYSILIIVFIILGYFIFFNRNENSKINSVSVKYGNVISKVSVTGIVKPSKNIDLAFETSGRLKKVYVKVGDKVSEGEILASLNNNDLKAQLMQAKASYESELASLNKMESGSRPEEIKAKELAYKSAKETLEKYYSSAINTIKDAYLKCNDGVRNKIDDLFNDDESSSPDLSYRTSDFQSKIDVEFYRLKVRNILNKWKDDIDSISESDYTSIDKLLNSSVDNVNVILTLYSKLQKTLDSTIGLSSSIVSTYKSSLGTARSNATVSMTSLNSSQKNIMLQKTQVEIAQNNLKLTKNGYTKNEIDIQKAKVKYAKGQVDYANALFEKSILRAPFKGIITKVNYDNGDIVQINNPVISIIGEGKYEIETNVAESDISRVHVGDRAEITLDAYGDNIIFKAKVTKIDLGTTMIEGVATYKTTLVFEKENKKILPGLTANIDIMSAQKENVLYVPTRNIIMEKGEAFVKKINKNGEISKIKIKTGLRGSNGRTEIISGLKEGDKILSE